MFNLPWYLWLLVIINLYFAYLIVVIGWVNYVGEINGANKDISDDPDGINGRRYAFVICSVPIIGLIVMIFLFRLWDHKIGFGFKLPNLKEL